MKRLIAAFVLLIICFCIYFLGSFKITSYCKEEKENLKTALSAIHKNDYQAAEKILKNCESRDDIIPYVYRENLKEIQTTINEARYYLKVNSKNNAIAEIENSIYLVESLKKEQNFNKYSYL